MEVLKRPRCSWKSVFRTIWRNRSSRSCSRVSEGKSPSTRTSKVVRPFSPKYFYFSPWVADLSFPFFFFFNACICYGLYASFFKVLYAIQYFWGVSDEDSDYQHISEATTARSHKSPSYHPHSDTEDSVFYPDTPSSGYDFLSSHFSNCYLNV